MNMKKTCKDCTERKVGCHGTCEYYIKRSKKAEEQRKKRYEALKLHITHNNIKEVLNDY